MHESVHVWCASQVPTEPVHVLDIGGRDVNGTTRDLFAPGTTTVSVDVREGPCVDIVADVCDVDLGPVFDVAICTSVMEHAENWREMIAAAYRMLKPGGKFITTIAGPGWQPHSAEDGQELRPGEYYHNVSPEELAEVMKAVGFKRVFTSDVSTSHPNDCVGYGWKD